MLKYDRLRYNTRVTWSDFYPIMENCELICPNVASAWTSSLCLPIILASVTKEVRRNRSTTFRYSRNAMEDP